MQHEPCNRLPVFLLACLLLVSGAVVGRAQEATAAPIPCVETRGHSSIARIAIFTPDGRNLVTAGDDKVVRVWNAGTGELERLLRVPVRTGSEGQIYAAALAPDGKTLAVAGYGMRTATEHCGDIRCLDFRTGATLRIIPGPDITMNALAFSPNGMQLISGDTDGHIRIYDTGSGRLDGELPGHTDTVYDLAFSPDGRSLASASLDTTVRIWNVATRESAYIFKGHTEKVRCVAWSPDGQTVATGSSDRTLRIWDPLTGQVRLTLPKQANEVSCLAFSRDGRHLALGTGGASGTSTTASVWLLPAGTIEREFKHNNSVFAVTFSPDGRTLASLGGSAHEVYLWNAATASVRCRMVGTGRPTVSVGWSRNGDRVAWGNTVDVVGDNDFGPLEHSFGVFTGRPGKAVAPNDAWVRAVTQRAGRTLATGKNKHELLVTSASGEAHSITKGDPSIPERVRCYTFTPTGEVVVGFSHSLVIYTADGKARQECVGHTSEVFGVAVSPDGRFLASVSSDQTVRVWSLRATTGPVVPLLSVFRGTDGEWVAWTQEGYYSGSAGGERLMGWQVNGKPEETPDYYSAYQFRRQLYRPDVISRLVEGGSTADAVRLADANRKGRPEPAPVIGSLLRLAPPRVTITSPADGSTVSAERVQIRAALADPNGRRLTGTTLLVNGRRQAGMDLILTANGASTELVATVTLSPGLNLLTILAVNDAGVESLPRSLRVTYTAANGPSPRPNLYVLAVGVSQYRDPRLALKFAAKDAADFAGVWQKQQGRLFGKVTTKLLTDRDATRNEVVDALDWLGKTVTRNDWAVVFVSGQAVVDNLNEYYFAPSDVDAAKLKRTSVAWGEFRTTLAALPGRVLLVLDTCHDAGVIGTDERGRDPYTELLREAATDEAGLITFAACRAQEQNLDPEVRHSGAFAQALVEALSGKADEDADGTVTLTEVDVYVTDRVDVLTGDRQHPIIQRPSTIRGDLPLALVGKN